MQSLREPLVWSHHLKQLLQGTWSCYSAQLLSFYVYLSLDAIGTVCHQFGLLRTDLHLIPCSGFPQLEHLCHMLGSFCEPLHWNHGPYMKCSIASGSISSQKPAFFSLTLQSRSIIHRHTEIWKWQGSASASPLIQEICCYLSKWASAL